MHMRYLCAILFHGKMKTDNPLPNRFSVFAGPCSAESLSQLQDVAGFISQWNQSQGLKIQALRAGAWKPRTHPGQFEGYGRKAIRWLQRIKKEYGLAVATEVATTHHVECCLKAGIDILWVGARTSSNPFLMQEIASALQGCTLPVWIKNPISPDLGLWRGAVERIAKASKGTVGAIHRGFGICNPAPYRNAPLWEMAVEMKRSCPQTPLLCDPSHIGGKRELVAGIAQTSVDLEMDGLMIEVHPRPEEALSDAPQQLALDALGKLLSGLRFRDTQGSTARMTQIRCILDEIDDELVQLISRRMRLVEEIGRLKKASNLSVLQMNRWNAVVERALAQARAQGLDEDFVRDLFNCIHSEALRLQQ